MIRLLISAAIFLLLVACGGEKAAEPTDGEANALSRLTIDVSRITVSGLSSGGYMATQLHLAHSRVFQGAGVVAAGPWWCARGDVSRALSLCTKGGDFGLDAAVTSAKQLAESGAIDSLIHLDGDQVWLFSGGADTAVASDVVDAGGVFYGALERATGLAVQLDTVPAAHGFPTVDQGADCSEFVSPYINACGYDVAGEMLKVLYDSPDAVAAADPSGQFVPVSVPGAEAASLLDEASIYVPPQCAAGDRCGIHVSLHGCQQSSEVIGDTYIQLTGYNRWADALDLIVVYPQVKASSLVPMNPLGCWDWWGYTGEDYVARSAPQITAIKATLDQLAGSEL
ncbi:MAG: PHB depolymerase family esterase [Pseudomonadota bacterium]